MRNYKSFITISKWRSSLSKYNIPLLGPPRAPWGPLDSALMNDDEVFTLLFFKRHLVLQGAPSGFWPGF